ncbi:hypothetical protein B0H19DRAFT_115078 [Mycena capillaripes]|nr:hypothetical protein B0H19DRAFT_115078 [Mycena capillaripes]
MYSSFVFRAEIHRSGDNTLDAVLKVDATGERQEAFMNEAKAYQTTGKPFQGNVLPDFFGCFQTCIGSITVTCLVTEYCGEPMDQDLHEVDNPVLPHIIAYVVLLHQHGMTHGSLYPRNILVCEERPVLIDLEYSQNHTCGLRMKIVPGAMMPYEEEFGCEELFHLISRMGLWKPRTLRFCTNNVIKISIHSADDIISLIPSDCKPERRPALEKEAKHIYEELCEERRLAFGTDNITCDTKRIDCLEPASTES